MTRFLMSAGLFAMFSALAVFCRADAPAPYVLSNGLRVVMRERHAAPLIAIDLWVKAGVREEGDNEGGSAHFLEHTLFKGTRTRRAGEADSDIENLGATLNAATGPDYAHFYTTVASAHLEAALAILADIARNATLPAAELEHERGVILDELSQNATNPSGVLTDALYARAFRAHPYRRSPGGTPEQIRALRRDTLAAFYRRTYTPERCTLTLVGDLSPEHARQAARQAFGDWTPPAEQKIEERTPGVLKKEAENKGDQQKPELPSDKIENQKSKIENSRGLTRGQVGIAFPAPPAGDTVMACAAQVAMALLGENEVAGRLADERLNGTESAARYTPRRDVSLFILSGALPLSGSSNRPENAAETDARLTSLENALRFIVKSLQANPPSAAEIANAKKRIQGRLLFDQETDAGIAWAIGYADITGGTAPEQFLDLLQRLTAADLQRFIQRYLDPAIGIAVHLLPETAAESNK